MFKRWKEMDDTEKIQRVYTLIKLIVIVFLMQNVVGLLNNLKILGVI